jgi:riboflavin kinase/FMN adenylyltransferase
VQVIEDVSVPPFPGERTVVTIGAYDGVHVGHRAVIGEVRGRATREGCRSVVVTFDRHPASVVRPEAAPRMLTSLDQKIALLESTGVDAVVVVRFDERQAAEAAGDFVERVLVRGLSAKVVHVGEDFRFGHGRAGSVALLHEMGGRHDFTCEPLALVPRADGVDEPVSSTAIRSSLLPCSKTRSRLADGMLLVNAMVALRGPVVNVSIRPVASTTTPTAATGAFE